MKHDRIRAGHLRLALVVTLTPLLALSWPVEAAEVDSTSCLESVSREVKLGQRLTLLLRGGDTLEGSFAGVDGAALRLQVPDPSSTGSSIRELGEASITSIGYEEHHTNWGVPVIFSVLGAFVGYGVSQFFQDQEVDSFEASEVVYPILGAVAGFAIGYGITRMTGGREESFSCEGTLP